MPSTTQLRLLSRDLGFVGQTSQTQSFIPTGVPNIDELLRGGLPTGALAEVYGIPGSGKTTFVLSIAAAVVRSGGSVILLDCDGDIAPARATQALTSVQDPSALQRVIVGRVTSWEALVGGAPHLLWDEVPKHPGLRLIAVDSLATMFRTAAESAPHKRLEAFAMRMLNIASKFKLCVLLVNHARNALSDGHVVPAMGETWQHLCPTRLWMGWDIHHRCHAIEVQKSAIAPVGRVHINISDSGITATEDEQV